MEYADFDRILKRTIEILNAAPSGTFQSSLDARNKTRNIDAITAACEEACLTVAEVVASTPNEFRINFCEEYTEIEHRSPLPPHSGKPVSIEIQRYDGASWREADVKSKNYQQIESFRETTDDGNIYDEIPHDEQGSSLAGYADIWEEIFYFTGFAARVKLALATRENAKTNLPEKMESTAIKLSIGNCIKAGEGGYTMQIANMFTSQAMSDLAEFKTGKRVFAEVSAPAPDKQVHS